jgi:hypothetical protein
MNGLTNEQLSFPSHNNTPPPTHSPLSQQPNYPCSANNISPPLTVQGHQSQLSAPNNIPPTFRHISLRNKAADLFQVSLNAAFRHTNIPER